LTTSAGVGLRDANRIRSWLREEPFASLVAYPGAIAYPADGFAWNGADHRGRLDGTARVLVIGQTPPSTTIAWRILVAGRPPAAGLVQACVDRSYVMVNTFLYSVFGSASKNAGATRIATYRHKWLDAIFAHEPIEAVVSLGTLADKAWLKWAATPAGQAVSPAYQHITHPTAPESGAAKNQGNHAALITKMLANWNAGLQALAPAIAHPDKQRSLVLYGGAFADGTRSRSRWTTSPAGSPQWMATDDGWADRTGTGRRKTTSPSWRRRPRCPRRSSRAARQRPPCSGLARPRRSRPCRRGVQRRDADDLRQDLTSLPVTLGCPGLVGHQPQRPLLEVGSPCCSRAREAERVRSRRRCRPQGLPAHVGSRTSG
jgi:hypothetical protein